jgi:hypothetical protein
LCAPSTDALADILAYLQEGVEPEVEDDLAWAEKMVKLIEQLGLVTKDGRLPHAKLNSIWSNSLTNKSASFPLSPLYTTCIALAGRGSRLSVTQGEEAGVPAHPREVYALLPLQLPRVSHSISASSRFAVFSRVSQCDISSLTLLGNCSLTNGIEMPSIVQKLWKNSKDEVKVGRCYKFKTPLPDSFFSKFIVGFLRFRIESILIQQFW